MGRQSDGVREHPISLAVANRVVYSPHDYPATVYNQRWFSDPRYPENLPEIWDRYWGFIHKGDIAPVLLGESGTNLETASDRAWLTKLVQYLDESSSNGGLPVTDGEYGPSWAYWSWNPNSGDTGGILGNDWRTLDAEKLAAIEPILFHRADDDPSDPPAPVANGVARFEIKLSAASAQPVSVRYETVDGTAKAGDHYAPIAGTVTFAPGEISKIVSTQLFATPDDSGEMRFLLALSDAEGARLGVTCATATLIHDRVPPPPPAEPPGAAVHLTLTDNWGTGFVAAVTLRNTTPTAIDGWRVAVETRDLITSVWNGKIIERTSTACVIGNESYNGAVAAGASVGFGLQGSNTDPSEVLTAAVLSLGG